MIPIISLLLILTFSILITRIAAIALTYTGLSRQTARFQARSAFTGVGFTTEESEKVVNHPVRRKILLILMVLGNAGVVTAISSLILTFTEVGKGESELLRVVLLVGGIATLWTVSYSSWVDKRLSRVINKMLKRFTDLDVRDYAAVLHLAGEYTVGEILIRPSSWLANRYLDEVDLRAEGIAVLGITREDGTYIGIPHGTTRILPYDTLIVYGRAGALEQIDQRRRDTAGDTAHQKAVEEQERASEAERFTDPAQPGNR